MRKSVKSVKQAVTSNVGGEELGEDFPEVMIPEPHLTFIFKEDRELTR